MKHLRALYASKNKEVSDEELELMDEEYKAVWTTTSDLPDSCFMYIEPGGTKKDGITHPLSLRHLPIKNSNGEYDIAHVRNAIARIPQMTGISETKKRQLQARARRILESLNKKSLGNRIINAVKSAISPEETDMFTVYKDDSGEWLWRGTYSNIFRDRDNPPEILSEKAHQTFERMTAEGIVPMPELWLWHIPSSKFGETYDVWYEDGYAKAEGTIDKGMEYIAEKLSEMEGLGMSHGMPVQFIVRNKEDNSIIDAYVSKELTVLPVAKAANLLTDFSTFKEDVMNKPITEEQKEFLASAGFDDTKIAEIAELQKKEVPDMALKTETETEVIAEVEVAQEESEEKKRAMDVKPVPAACDDEEEMDEENKKKPKKGCKKEFVTPDELETVAKATADAVTSLSQQVASLTDQLKSIADAVKSLKELDEAKVVKAAEGTPAMSMAELIRKSVIGREETKVDGRTVLAQDKPKEAKAPGNDMPIGLGFMQGIFEGKSLKESVK